MNAGETLISSHQILSNLKRLQAMLKDMTFRNSSASKEMSFAYRVLHGVLTGQPDFQNSRRTPRRADDHLFEQIRDAEEQVVDVARKPMKPRGR